MGTATDESPDLCVNRSPWLLSVGRSLTSILTGILGKSGEKFSDSVKTFSSMRRQHGNPRGLCLWWPFQTHLTLIEWSTIRSCFFLGNLWPCGFFSLDIEVRTIDTDYNWRRCFVHETKRFVESRVRFKASSSTEKLPSVVNVLVLPWGLRWNTRYVQSRDSESAKLYYLGWKPVVQSMCRRNFLRRRLDEKLSTFKWVEDF